MSPRGSAVSETDAEPHGILSTGLARLAKLAFDGADLAPYRGALEAQRHGGTGEAAGALLELAVVEQLSGNLDRGLARQREALALTRLYHAPGSARRDALRVLALAAPGDIGTNAPIEFLLEGRDDVALDTLYVLPGGRHPVLPDYDIAIVTAGESDANRPVLAEIERLTQSWRIPTLNDPRRIIATSRDGVARLLHDVPGLLAPPMRRYGRHALARQAPELPMIVRPIDSHAGRGLVRIEDWHALDAYLADRAEASFFVAPFVDYRSADGLFRKYRIALVGRRPYASHMAISSDWMIYYLNAGMRESAAKRAEEARFMAEFETGFAHRHRIALAAVAERIGLDYFAIDCGETPDGRLLFFEADVAMIVHAMDPPALFPYKGPAMRTLFDAFAAMLHQRARG